MKSKKIVKVELKNPSLRRIRKNFRDVIKLAVKQESSRLFAKSCEYRKKRSESTDLAEEEMLEQKKSYFRRGSDRLDNLLSDSIIQCGLGGGCSSLPEAIKRGLDPRDRPTDLDMAWVPFLGAWFCTKCCKNLIEGEKILREERHPDYMRWLKDH